jgi:hypothetical protein
MKSPARGYPLTLVGVVGELLGQARVDGPARESRRRPHPPGRPPPPPAHSVVSGGPVAHARCVTSPDTRSHRHRRSRPQHGQDQRRLAHQSRRGGHPLLLATGELPCVHLPAWVHNGRLPLLPTIGIVRKLQPAGSSVTAPHRFECSPI